MSLAVGCAGLDPTSAAHSEKILQTLEYTAEVDFLLTSMRVSTTDYDTPNLVNLSLSINRPSDLSAVNPDAPVGPGKVILGPLEASVGPECTGSSTREIKVFSANMAASPQSEPA